MEAWGLSGPVGKGNTGELGTPSLEALIPFANRGSAGSNPQVLVFPTHQQPHVQSTRRDFPMHVKALQAPSLTTETTRVPSWEREPSVPENLVRGPCQLEGGQAPGPHVLAPFLQPPRSSASVGIRGRA